MSLHSRRSSGILTPPSPTISHNLAKISRKRKRDDEISNGHEVLIAKPHPNSSSTTSVTIETICSLPRARVPLAWLDTTSTSTLLPSGNVCQLNQKPRIAPESQGTSLLVVKCPTFGDMFVMEEVEQNIYIAVRLADWVTIDHVQASARGEPLPSILEQLLATQRMNDRLQDTPQITQKPPPVPVKQPDLPKQPIMRKGALARMAILPREETESLPHVARSSTEPLMSEQNDMLSSQPGDLAMKPPQHIPTNETVEPMAVESSLPMTLPNAESQPIPLQPAVDDIQVFFEKLHGRYLETLYISKTSVAYFAKGPLARARAVFSSSASPAQDPMELIQFYRDSVIPLKKMDLKYKDTLLSCIKSREDETSKPRKRKKTARKMGRDGLYPDEPDFITRWWETSNLESASVSPEAELQKVKTLSTDLRSRETQLQILLILEAMVLEAKQAKRESLVKRESVEPQIADIPSKKKQDLKTHLDLLADRLCIWHTVSFDDFTEDKAPSKKQNDKLRDFCVEVIIPFYASKLPDQCKALSKKLGGPSDISPKRTRAPLSKSASTSKTMPGAEIKRKPPVSLQRALTEDMSRSRSPSIPLLKREPSERPVSRAGMQARFLESRQVDLVAAAKQQESKMKKLTSLAEQKKQLDAAISMLRKPNRSIVAKDIVEESERRQESSKNSKPASRSVQVMATPRKKRTADFLAESQQAEVEVIPEVLEVPSSSVRPQPTVSDSANRQSIHETPSRGNGRATDLLAPPSMSLMPPTTPVLLVTPTKPSQPPTYVESTPIGSRTITTPLGTISNTPLTAKLRMTKSQRPVSFTPLKKSDSLVMEAFANAPEVKQSPNPTNEDDIYARLGWMDDGFDL